MSAAAIRSYDQPVMGGYSDDERDAAGLVLNNDYFDTKIVDKIGVDGMLNRRLNHLVCAATIFGHTREFALEMLCQRAELVRETLAANVEEDAAEQQDDGIEQ